MILSWETWRTDWQAPGPLGMEWAQLSPASAFLLAFWEARLFVYPAVVSKDTSFTSSSQSINYCALFHPPREGKRFDREMLTVWTWVNLAATSAFYGPPDPYFFSVSEWQTMLNCFWCQMSLVLRDAHILLAAGAECHRNDSVSH